MKYLSADETLFKNEELFDFSYVPDQFNFRDSQLKSMAYCLRPAMRGAKPLNALLIGPPATGKTTAVKLTFEQFEAASDKAVLVHVNCQIHPTPFRIFSEIYRKLFGYLPPETGIPLSTLYDKIFKKLGKRVLIVALDDVNYLQDHEKVVYDLLRAHESYPDVKIGLISVSQRNEMHKLSDRVRSVFQPQVISFLPYKRDEIYGILKQRTDAGLYDKVMSDKVLERIADATSERNDLRFGIGLVKQAVMQAELDGERRVKEGHIEKALGSAMPETREVRDDERLILDLLKREMTSGELYDVFKKKTSASYSSFYRLLKDMEKKVLIKAVEKVAKKGGITRLITRV